MSVLSLSCVAVLLAGHGGGKPMENGIKWEHSFDEALKKARAAHKPVLIDFWAEWCGWCHRLDQTTYVDPRVVKMSEDFVAVKVDTEGGAKQAQVAEHYDVGEQLPTIVFASPQGRVLLKVTGFQGPGQFPATIEKAKETAARVMAWESALDEDANDAMALMRLGTHLFEQEYYEESRELLSRAARADEKSPTADRKKTRMLIGIIQVYAKKYPDAERVLKEAIALQPAGEYEPRLLFVLGRTYFNSGKTDKAREAMEQVIAGYPGSVYAGKARETLLTIDRTASKKN